MLTEKILILNKLFVVNLNTIFSAFYFDKLVKFIFKNFTKIGFYSYKIGHS